MHEVMGWNGPMTRRQFLVWKQWLDDQWNEPTRDNYYQMQIALEARESQLRQKSGNVKSMRIRFLEAKPQKKQNAKQVAALSRNRLIAAFGGLQNIKVTYVEKADGS